MEDKLLHEASEGAALLEYALMNLSTFGLVEIFLRELSEGHWADHVKVIISNGLVLYSHMGEAAILIEHKRKLW